MLTVDPIPGSLLALCPEALRVASAEFASAALAAEEATHDLAESTAGVQVATQHDEQAAISAVENGNAMPKETLPKAEQALTAARRKAAALTKIAEQKQRTYLDALRSGRDEIVSAARSERQTLADLVDQSIATLAGLLSRHTELASLTRELSGDALAGRGVVFRAPQANRALPTAVGDPLTALRSAVRG